MLITAERDGYFGVRAKPTLGFSAGMTQSLKVSILRKAAYPRDDK